MTYIIAEIGNNHQGKHEMALQLVRSAIYTGVDAVKLQLFRAETLVDKSMPSMVPTHETQFERMKALELPQETYVAASKLCHDAGRDFIVSSFDPELIEWVTPYIDKIKIASGDMMYRPVLNAAYSSGKDMIVSTGMHNLDQIDAMVEDYEPWAILHCVSQYPTQDDYANLGFVTDLINFFAEYEIGYSDHTIGITACLAATALGASVIEKHYKAVDNFDKRGDLIHSATHNEMSTLVHEARRIDTMLSACNMPGDSDMKKYLVRGENGLRGTY